MFNLKLNLRLDLVRIVNSIVETYGRGVVSTRADAVHSEHARLFHLPDDTLREYCKRTLEGHDFGETKPDGFFSRLWKRVRHFGSLPEVDELTLRRLALAVAAFQRAPADLDEGCHLFDQQIRGAVALSQRALIQMDTGEGKTYAILPAAFALCCKYHRVYVICANDYLAERDAHRTRPFWDFVGVALGLGMANGSEAWSKRVVYTTLRSLMFHHIFCEIAVRTQLAPISFGAAILDEADAILLDQSLTPYIHTANVPAKLHDWETSLALAGDLENEKDIIVDTDDFSASLTLEGEQKLKAMLGSPSAMSQRDLVMRDAVENAFIALFHVEEDRDYVVEGLRAYPIDRKTGEVHRGQTLGWIFPLEYRLGLPPRPGMVVLQSLQPRVFLKGFAHISGLSGTIAPDAFEYIASYQLPCITIEPRRPRQDGMQDDIIFATREEAHDQVLETVRTAVAAGRPVLVGAQSIKDAQDLHEHIERSSLKADLKLLTAKNDAEIADVLSHAGQSSSVVVATQQAGRGVDIRLSDAARQAGGMYIIGLEHAEDARHDRQFLGRAGRQGDPWTGVFICSLDGRMFKVLGAARMKRVLETLGHERGETIVHPWINAAIRQFQGKIYVRDFLWRRSQEPLLRTGEELRRNIRVWFAYAQGLERNLDRDAAGPAGIAEWMIGRYLDLHLANRLPHARLKMADAALIVSELDRLFLLVGGQSGLKAHVLESKSPADARRIVEEQLKARLLGAIEAAQTAKEDVQNKVLLVRSVSGRLSSQLEHAKSTAERLLGRPLLIAAHAEPAASTTPPIEDQLDFDVLAANDMHLTAHALSLPSSDALSTAATTLSQVRRAVDAEATRQGVPASRLAQCQRELADLQETLDVVLDVQQNIDRYRSHMARDPASIANWTVRLASKAFLDEERSIISQVAHEGNSRLQQPITTRYRLLAAWDELEAKLTQQMIAHLLAAPEPGKLDFVFELQNEDEREQRLRELLSATDAECIALGDSEIREFVNLSAGDAGPEEEKQFTSSVLQDFLDHHPLVTLQSPSRVELALTTWLGRQKNMRAGRRQLARYREKLDAFLQFLKQRGAVPALPTAGRARRPGLISAFQNLNVIRMMSIYWAAFILVSFPLLSLLHVRSVEAPAGIWRYVETVIFGNLLQIGAFTAPAIGGLLFPILLFGALYPKWLGINKGQGLDRLVAPIAIAATSFFIALSGSAMGNVSDMALGLAWFVAMSFYAYRVTHDAWSLENYTGVNLLQAWLSYTTLMVLVQDLWPVLGHMRATATFAVVAAGLLWLRQRNLARIDIASARLQQFQTGSEHIQSRVRVRAEPGPAAHVFAVLLAVAVHSLAPVAASEFGTDNVERLRWMATVAGALTYLVAILLFTVSAAGRQFSTVAWAERLSTNREVIRGCEDVADRDRFLQRTKRNLLAWELLVLATTAGFVYAVAGDVVTSDGYSVALIVLLTASLFSYSASTFGEQAWAAVSSALLATGSAPAAPTIELQPPQRSRQRGGRMARFGQFLLDRPAILSVGLAIASFLITHWAVIVQAISALFRRLAGMGG